MIEKYEEYMLIGKTILHVLANVLSKDVDTDISRCNGTNNHKH